MDNPDIDPNNFDIHYNFNNYDSDSNSQDSIQDFNTLNQFGYIMIGILLIMSCSIIVQNNKIVFQNYYQKYNMNKYLYTHKKIIQNNNLLNDCSICLEIFKNNESVISLPCNHIFHHECIQTWLKNSNNCPLCRQIIQ